MIRSIKYLYFAFFVLSIFGCANPSIVRVKEAEINDIDVTSIYIPRFEGNPAFVEESTDMFVAKLEPQIQARIIQGSVIRDESTDIVSGGNIAPIEIAIAAAKRHNSQILVLGKITSHNTGMTLNGFSTIRVINVKNGNIVASFHRPRRRACCPIALAA